MVIGASAAESRFSGGIGWAPIITTSIFLVPAIGIFKRYNWCRFWLGLSFSFILLQFVWPVITTEALPYDTFSAVASILVPSFFALPVYLCFFSKPLKTYTRKIVEAEQDGASNAN